MGVILLRLKVFWSLLQLIFDLRAREKFKRSPETRIQWIAKQIKSLRICPDQLFVKEKALILFRFNNNTIENETLPLTWSRHSRLFDLEWTLFPISAIISNETLCLNTTSAVSWPFLFHCMERMRIFLFVPGSFERNKGTCARIIRLPNARADFSNFEIRKEVFCHQYWVHHNGFSTRPRRVSLRFSFASIDLQYAQNRISPLF